MGLLGKLFRDHGKRGKGASVVAEDSEVIVAEAEHKMKEKSVFTKLSSRPMSFVGKRDNIISAKANPQPEYDVEINRKQNKSSPCRDEASIGGNAASAPTSSQSNQTFIIGDGDVASSSSSTVDSISSTSGEASTADTSPSTSNPSIPLKATGPSSGSLSSMRRTSPLSTVVDSNSIPTPPPSPPPTSHSMGKPSRRNSLINIFSLRKAKSHSTLSLPTPAHLPSPSISSNSSSTSLRSTSSRNTATTRATSVSGRSHNSFRAPMPLNHPDLAFVPSVEDFSHSSILAGDPLGGNYYLYPKSGRAAPPPRRRTAPPSGPPQFPSYPSHHNKQQRFMEPTILEETGGNNPQFVQQYRQNGPRPQDPRRRSMPVPPQHYNNLNMYLAPPQQNRRRSMYNNYDNGGMPMPMPPRNNNWRRTPPGSAGDLRSAVVDGKGVGREQQAGQAGEIQDEKQKIGSEAESIPTVTVQAAA